MPTMPERMSVVETELKSVKTDVAEIKSDVKTIVGWMNEERGAREQRSSGEKKMLAVVSAIAGLIAACVGFVVDALFPLEVR